MVLVRAVGAPPGDVEGAVEIDPPVLPDMRFRVGDKDVDGEEGVRDGDGVHAQVSFGIQDRDKIELY